MPDPINDLTAVQIPPPTRRPVRSQALAAQFPCEHLVVGCGVAIFHVATARVVLCYHTRDRYWFLPKGRRDAGEETTRAAEREGFEESGYRNRLLPLPLPHRQPSPAHHAASSSSSPSTATRRPLFTTEPIWTQLLPVSPRTQYLLFWHAAETLAPALEASLPPPSPSSPYVAPPPYPEGLTLRERVRQEDGDGGGEGERGYEPRRWEGTGVDEEEALYDAQLVPVAEAAARLGGASVMADVVRRGWEAVVRRLEMEGLVGEEEEGGGGGEVSD